MRRTASRSRRHQIIVCTLDDIHSSKVKEILACPKRNAPVIGHTQNWNQLLLSADKHVDVVKAAILYVRVGSVYINILWVFYGKNKINVA